MRENASTIALAVVSVFILLLHILTMLKVVELTSSARDEGALASAGLPCRSCIRRRRALCRGCWQQAGIREIGQMLGEQTACHVRSCEGFRMPAHDGPGRALRGPTSGKPHWRKP